MQSTARAAVPVVTVTAEAARLNRAVPAPSSDHQGAGALPRAPSRAPLTPSGAGGAETGEAEGSSGEVEEDPLVSNGLGSPSCQRATAQTLSATDRLHCESSGFVATAAPTGNYGIDVHIDTGVLGVGSWLSSAIQDIVIRQAWMGAVWFVHALVVMLEWCFTIDLLPSAAVGSVGRGLRQMEANFTEPWLPMALAGAAILATYHGLIRRRVAETVGEVLVMAAMMVGGLWVISDPTGTVGALGGWANQAALGTLAVAAQGAPTHPERTFTASLDTVFSQAIEGPWCYLEFGDVGWCREPARMDPQLHGAALKIAAAELAQVGCVNAISSAPCVARGSEPARVLERAATLLRFARSNGAIFLALPADGPARNSINQQGSLLRTMCQSSNLSSCRGPEAAQAQFRTAAQTGSRLGGLLLIIAGLLGMLLLFGFLALRLLMAALFSLLFLLLAPAMVLAPAFGEGGRALFRKWGLQLLGTVVAKLLFSFLLGVVLALVGVISNLTALGWWTQWLLMSALWWGAYVRRHQALGLAGAAGREQGRRISVARRVGALEERRRAVYKRWNEFRNSGKPPPEVEPPTQPPPRSPPPERTPPSGGDSTSADADAPSDSPATLDMRPRPADGATQLEPVRQASREAEADGDEHRLTRPGAPGRRSEEPPARDTTLNAPPDHDGPGGAAERRSPGISDRPQQSEVAGAVYRPVRDGATRLQQGDARDYAALATLAGYSRAEYEGLDAPTRREARLKIDRELAARQELGDGPHSSEDRRSAQIGGPSDEDSAGKVLPVTEGELPRRGRELESTVLHDVDEWQAGRKRQLGLGRP